MDRASDEREHEDEILAEVVELEAEIEEDYQRNFAEYKKQLEEWKLWRRKQVPATLRKLAMLTLVCQIWFTVGGKMAK